jgi:hypothetical protein
MAKRNSKGQFVKGSKSSGSSKRKASKGAKGSGIEARVSRLEHNQKLLVGVVDGMEQRLSRVEGVVSKLAGGIGARFKRKGSKRKGSKKSAGASV